MLHSVLLALRRPEHSALHEELGCGRLFEHVVVVAEGVVEHAAKKGPAAVLARLPGEERAPRCLLLAALLMIAYILLDALSCLLAALLLLFLALAGRGRAAESGERELF